MRVLLCKVVLWIVIEFVTVKDRELFLNSCRNDYPSSEDEGQPLHKVALITQPCIIIRQLITLSSTAAAPLLCWDSVADVSSPEMTPQSITTDPATDPLAQPAAELSLVRRELDRIYFFSQLVLSL